MELANRIGRHVYNRNGILTDVKYFEKTYMGKGIRKLNGTYCEDHLMQMKTMPIPNLSKELHYLNKENRLMRWLLVKYRDTIHYGIYY